MKIFISWSGKRSHEVAKLLDSWIQCVIQAVDPWLSSKDIDRGSLWFSEITSQLASTYNGIICLTKSNKDNPWILFESGALAKGLSSSRVYTFLIDLGPSDVIDPLAQFNHSGPDKESLFQLVRSINNGLGDQALRETIISNIFETYWPQFEKEFENIINNTSDEDITDVRPKSDLLHEVLYAVRGIDKRLRHFEINQNNEDHFTGINWNDDEFVYRVNRDIMNYVARGWNEKDIYDAILEKLKLTTIDERFRLKRHVINTYDKYKPSND